jgi:hypothetical protein
MKDLAESKKQKCRKQKAESKKQKAKSRNGPAPAVGFPNFSFLLSAFPPPPQVPLQVSSFSFSAPTS